jgi:hypothetical protein
MQLRIDATNLALFKTMVSELEKGKDERCALDFCKGCWQWYF